MTVNNPLWRQFEQAVADFVAALDPTATVRHNIRVPDIDTGKSRQQDVWVEAKICGHIPIRVLISCKRKSALLNSQDIDAFVGELRSSGANKGVLYSLSGYTKPALKKADKLSILCCRLYQGEPPDIPNILIFRSFCCTSRAQLSLDRIPEQPIRVYNDLFDIKVGGEGGQQAKIIDLISEAYLKSEKNVIAKASAEKRFPASWSDAFQLTFDNSSLQSLTVTIRGTWRVWSGRLEAHLVSGAYVLNNQEFIGRQFYPAIDMKGPGPGPGWELLQEAPTVVEPSTAIFFLYGGSVSKLLKEALGEQPISQTR